MPHRLKAGLRTAVPRRAQECPPCISRPFFHIIARKQVQTEQEATLGTEPKSGQTLKGFRHPVSRRRYEDTPIHIWGGQTRLSWLTPFAFWSIKKA